MAPHTLRTHDRLPIAAHYGNRQAVQAGELTSTNGINDPLRNRHCSKEALGQTLWR